MTASLWTASLAAWLVAVVLARSAGSMASMSPGFWAFTAMWTPMMAAMMLPSVEPVATLWVRTVQSDRARRLTQFVGGYLVLWAGVGLPAFGLVSLGSWLGRHHPAGATTMVVVFFAACGAYQLSPLKQHCLRHCRSPFGSLLHYASFRGPLRDLRVGLHHAGWCVGCCWALMGLLVAFGTMNVLAMVVLAGVVFAEKRWVFGPILGRAVGAACILLAAAAVFSPGLAPALHQTPAIHMRGM